MSPRLENRDGDLSSIVPETTMKGQIELAVPQHGQCRHRHRTEVRHRMIAHRHVPSLASEHGLEVFWNIDARGSRFVSGSYPAFRSARMISGTWLSESLTKSTRRAGFLLHRIQWYRSLLGGPT